jgi:branched-chain amino acid transport system permease protein
MFFSFVSPDLFDFNLTIVILSMLVVGGIGTIAGPIVGAVALGLVSETLRRATAYQEVLYGVILVLFMVFAPSGLVGLARGLRVSADA